MYEASADFLDALYVVTEALRRLSGSTGALFRSLREAEGGREVIGLRYLRGPAVHQAVVAQTFEDRYPDIYYTHYGVWVWATGITSDRPNVASRADYEDIVSAREVFATSSSAYACIVGLLSEAGVEVRDPDALHSEVVELFKANQSTT